MDNGFKVRITRMFQSPFNSCRTKPTSDVIDHPFFFPENHHHRQLIDLFSPKPQPFQKPKKIPTGNPILPEPTFAGKPHAATLPPPVFYQNKPKPTKKKRTHHRKTTKSQDFSSFSSITDNYYYDCCSSDEEKESSGETTLFSSRSLSSDSSESFRKNRAFKKPKKTRSGCKGGKATDVIPIPLKGKGKFIKDSVAVVKKSDDPHDDFRVSMLEMIVERQIFGAKDLESLLECFLSLNSKDHHRVIFEVFTEIWETLFSDWL